MTESDNKEQQNSRNKQAISFKRSNPERTTKIWDDGSITLQVYIGKTKKFRSSILMEYLFPELQIDETVSIPAKIKEEEKSKFSLTRLSITKKSFKRRGKVKQKLVFSCKDFARLIERQITIQIPTKDCQISPLFQIIKQFATIGYELQKLMPILQHKGQNVILKRKTEILELFFTYLTRQKDLEPIIQFRDYYGKKVSLYDDTIIAATFDGGIPDKTDIQIPNIIGNLFIRNQDRIVVIRDNQITSSTVTNIKNSYRCDSAVSMTTGKRILLLWTGLERTKDYDQMLLQIKNNNDYRSHLALTFYKNTEEKAKYQRIIDGLEYLCENGYSLPIIRNKARNSTHLCEGCEFLVTQFFNLLNKSFDDKTKGSFVAKEALLSNIGGTYFKSIDWYIVKLEGNELEKYSIELKMCHGKEKTRILQRTIAELSKLQEKIPDIGLPIIIVNWLIDKKKWKGYAAKFGVIILDSQDLFELIKNGDFFERMKKSSQQIVRHHKMRKVRKEKKKEKSQKLITKWQEKGMANREEIKQYCNLMEIPVQNFLYLLNYLAICPINANSSYYRKSHVEIVKPKELEKIHLKLLQGTSLIIEEELAHCKERIKVVKTQGLKPNTDLSFQRRRQTYDLDRLTFVYENLSTLLSLQKHWGKRFRPIGIRMLQHEDNQGAAFEQSVCDQLQKENYKIIQNVSLMIANKPREIDIIGFKLSSTEEATKLVVSCSDSSNYTDKFYYTKRSIISRLRNLQLIRKEIDFQEARLYVKVGTTQQKELVEKWIREEKRDESKVTIKIILNGRKEKFSKI
ncbi:MAG: hypothetical protein GF308_10340 [Candidatus Heimdallarchaeota archaeon]|nr:hypothetical protein [Candidatus Heimdallarchaeota archaeon]